MSKHRFSQLMDDIGTIYDKEITPTIKRLYWEDLGEMPIELVEAAIQSHRRDPDRGRYFPKPADIIAKMPMQSDPTANEAWGLCMTSFDEEESVCISDAIFDARLAAAPMWNDGDKIGARMAFKDAYERAMAVRKAKGERPMWSLSVGHDPQRRIEATKAAVKAGLLSHEAAKNYLPAPEITPDGSAIAGLLTGKDVPEASEDVRSRIKALLAAINPTEDVNKSEKEREAFAAAKRKALDDLAALQAKRSTSTTVAMEHSSGRH